MEKKASLAQSYQSQSVASRPIDDSNKGSKLLKAMGWKECHGLGKSGQGRTDIIEAEQRVSNAGLGTKNSSYGAGNLEKEFFRISNSKFFDFRSWRRL